MSKVLDVCQVNLFQRTAILTDDRVVPVTSMLDSDGDETSDPDCVAAFVCGEGDTWFSESMTDYGERLVLQ